MSIKEDKENEYKKLPTQNYVARKQRSMDMLNEGVEPIKNGFNEYFIPSQVEQGRKYKVTINKGWYACECPDNAQNRNLCKHILLLKTYFAIKLKAQEAKKNVSVSYPCPTCNSENLQKHGTRRTTAGLKQRWLCKECGKRFVNQPVSKIKGNVDMVITAMDLCMKGVSYRNIADSIRQFYGLKVTHVTIMNWVTEYMSKINNYVETLKPNVSDKWLADEQFIKAKGKQEYVWNVLDEDTRFLLASNESPTRSYTDARATFQQAKATAGKKALTIVTDGAFSYEKAVRKEFATYKNPKPHYRYVSMRSKDASNNRIERYHNSFRSRDKVMRGFNGKQKQFTDNFRTYYNFVRTHQGMGVTPAQKAGIPQNPNWKELLMKSLSN